MKLVKVIVYGVFAAGLMATPVWANQCVDDCIEAGMECQEACDGDEDCIEECQQVGQQCSDEC